MKVYFPQSVTWESEGRLGSNPGRDRSWRRLGPSSRRLPAQRLENDGVDTRDAVGALLQVRRAGPRVEGLLELSLVTEFPEPFLELCAQRLIDVEPVLRRCDAEQLVVQRVDPAELGNWKLVIVDAQIDDRVGQVRVARVLLHDEQGGGLLPAAVPAGGLRGGQAFDEPFGQREVTVRLERHGQSVHGLTGHEDVSLRRIALAGPAAGPLVALRAGERRGSPRRVNDPDLAVLSALVGSRKGVHHLLSRLARAQQRQTVRSVTRIRPRLRGDGADVR